MKLIKVHQVTGSQPIIRYINPVYIAEIVEHSGPTRIYYNNGNFIEVRESAKDLFELCNITVIYNDETV